MLSSTRSESNYKMNQRAAAGSFAFGLRRLVAAFAATGKAATASRARRHIAECGRDPALTGLIARER
jgi:hypothetical protein